MFEFHGPNDEQQQTLHAYWECSTGLSAPAMLDACVQAASQHLTWRGDPFDALHEVLLNVFPDLLEAQVDVEAAKDGGAGGGGVAGEYDADHRPSSLRKHLKIFLKDNIVLKWTSLMEMVEKNRRHLSPWTAVKFAAALESLEMAEHNTFDIPLSLGSHQVARCAVEMISIFWLLDQIGVSDSSYPPIPVLKVLHNIGGATPGEQLHKSTTNFSTNRVRQILKGMNVSTFNTSVPNNAYDNNKNNLTYTTDCFYSDTAIAILKSLSTMPSQQQDVNYSQQVAVSPDKMNVHSISLGKDDTIPAMSVTLVLGTPTNIPTTSNKISVLPQSSNRQAPPSPSKYSPPAPSNQPSPPKYSQPAPSNQPAQATRSPPAQSKQFQVSSSSSRWEIQTMLLLESNIDDMTAEHLAFAVERLIDAGAADAWVSPIIMKKGRAAHTLSCLCNPGLQDEMLTVIFRHTTTIGVRFQKIDRAALPRKTVTVQTEWAQSSNNGGRVDVKVASLGQDVVSMKPEFDHCKAISLAANVPIQLVTDQAMQKASKQISKGSY